MENLHNKLSEMITGNVPLQSEMATVKAVDKEKLECTVVPIANEELVIEEVNLKAVIDETKNGFVQIPKVGSMVLISLIENTDGDHYISMCSDIDGIQLIQDNEEILKIDNLGNVCFHGGENKGLVKVESLVEKLNALEKKVNDFIVDYKGHNHVHPQGPTTAFLTPSVLTALTETQAADLENGKVKH